MQIILSDQNCEGHADAIFMMVERDFDWVPMKLMKFRHVGLNPKADDETVWRFCQEHGYILLTGNRTGDDGQISLELTIRRLLTPQSLPVITIGNLGRVLGRSDYCLLCAERLCEIVLDLEDVRGITRLYIPGSA